jgi:lysophospholipase L1-like esterase
MKKLAVVIHIAFLFFYTGAFSQHLPAFWKDVVAFKKLDSAQKPVPHSILFIGSSSFTRWTDAGDYFPGYTITNRAFGGSTLPDLIRYFYEVIVPYQPKQIFIYCGENDLAYDESVTADEVLRRFKTLYAMIRVYYPEVTVDYVSIKPSPSRPKIQDRAKAANAKIKAFLAKEKKAAFINIYDAMLDANGKMREELYVQDRLHMKPEGYQIWKRIFMPYMIK